ncbi:hypothetical protein D4R75_03700 [bacterium]|nr:MAG: hypothetical protein D4R75_03700 [bacterium]
MAGWPPEAYLHAKVRRFGTQASGNDIGEKGGIFVTTFDDVFSKRSYILQASISVPKPKEGAWQPS